MTRTTGITVCVVTGDDRRATRQFLARLARGLGPHDNVLLAGPGRTPPSDAASWRVPTRGGELRRVDGGTPPGARPVVIFVDDRVEAIASWIDVLCEAFEDAGVGAASPRTNVADGDELLIGVPYRPDEHGVKNVLMRDLAATARGALTDATMLAGPCLAVRRESLGLVGGLDAVTGQGFDPAGLAAAISVTGRRLVVVEGCYLHHPGGPPRRPDPREFGRPLVTACLIVRDEQEDLPRCLASMTGFADEVVVYDTGSVDGTIQLAEEAGATVVRGYWDDDFGRARNDALDSCRGQWILWLDADEALVCEDPTAARAALASVPSDIESFVLLIDNLVGNEAGSTFTHPASRLFRRAHGHWQGHLHEQVHARAGRRVLAGRLYDAARIAHRGYLQSHIAGKAKGERNLRSAFSDLVGDGGLPWSTRLLSLSRSYALAGRTEEGVDLARTVLRISADPSELRLARRTVIDGLLGLGRIDEIPEEIDALRSSTSNQALADVYEGHLLLAREQYEQAVVVFGRVHRSLDDDGFEYTPAAVAGPKAEALAKLERFDEAVETLLTSIRDSGGVNAHVGQLVECMEQAGRDLGEIYDAVGSERSEHFVPQLVQLQPSIADRVLDAWHRRDPGSKIILAAAARVAPKLEIPRQLVWSSRLRAVGFASACPLVRCAADPATAPLDRVLAAAAATTLFSDARARQVFGVAVLASPPELDADMRAAVASIAPDLVATIDRLGRHGPEGAADTAAPATRREVLIVDRGVAGLRTASVATMLARSGHGVTILQPLPATTPAQLPKALGITVQGWNDGGESTWLRTSQAAIAASSAERPYDVVVVRHDALALIAIARAILPRASIVVDLDRSPPPTDTEGVDLLLTATDEASRSQCPAARSFAPPGSLFARQPPTALEARKGVCVLGDTRTLPADEAEHFGSSIAPPLLAACQGEPIAVCGDDPEGYLSRGLQTAVVAGPVADPLPWIRAARVALVAVGPNAGEWLAAAAACGTPVILASAIAGAPEATAERVAQLLRNDTAWQEAHDPLNPGVETSREATTDVLALLPTPATPAPEVERTDRLLARVTLEATATTELSEIARELESRMPREPGRGTGTAPRPLLEVRVASRPDIAASGGAAVGLVNLLAWPHGGLPAEWVAPVRDCLAEMWVPSSWARRCAIDSGVAADHVAVVPRGVDPAHFSPDGRSFALRTTKTTKLLFIGPCTERAGLDALLECYLSAFTAADDVCLVARPFAPDSSDSSTSFERELRRAVENSGPSIEIIDGELPGSELAELYRSCSALVHIHRGEALASRVLEAMACGLPVIVPAEGATTDLCDEDVAWLVKSRPRAITSSEWTPSRAGAWWQEPDRQHLIETLLGVAGDPESAKRKGTAARQRVVERFTWDDVARTAISRLERLARR